MSSAPRGLTLRGRVAARIKTWLDAWSGTEGSWRGPVFGESPFGRWFGLGRLEDGFQRDLSIGPHAMQAIPVVSGIRHLHRSAFAQLRPEHINTDGGRDIKHITTSAAFRVMSAPNVYETGADFNARLADEWLCAGEVACWALRNGRGEVDTLHILPRGSWQLAIDPQSKAAFYLVNSTGALLEEMNEASIAVPARDVLHLRWATPRHPLIGESAFAAAGLAAGINVALSASQAAFFGQMRRPSGVLATEHVLNDQQIKVLREAFDKQSTAMASGGIPILGGGLKWQAMGISSEDAQVIEALRMSNEEIARCCGVPPPLIGELQAGALASTETLIALWLSISLGGLIERFERGLERLFGFDGATDTVNMDVAALLRTNLQARIDALTKGVQGGILTPNEARRTEGYGPIDGGDQAFMQRQNTPIDLLGELAAADLVKAPAPPTPAPALADDSGTAADAAATGAGEDNAQGDAAAAGKAHVARLRGEKGERGERGEKGEKGEKGEPGAPGEKGERGEKGAPGEPGVPGIDGRDGASPAALEHDADSAELVFTDGSRFEFPLLPGERGEKGAPGERGEPGPPGIDGRDGADAPPVDLDVLVPKLAIAPAVVALLERLVSPPEAWMPRVYRCGSLVSHFLGRVYLALVDTVDQPGDSDAWRRVGTAGERHTGPFDAARTYEVGDRYVKDRATFIVVDSTGAARLHVPRAFSESDLQRLVGIHPLIQQLVEANGQTAVSLIALTERQATALDVIHAHGLSLEGLDARLARLEGLAS